MNSCDSRLLKIWFSPSTKIQISSLSLPPSLPLHDDERTAKILDDGAFHNPDANAIACVSDSLITGDRSR
jgi:hypothetical protein